MKRRVLSIIVAAVLVMAGCGSQQETEAGTGTETAEKLQAGQGPGTETAETGEALQETEESSMPEETEAPEETGETEASAEAAGETAEKAETAQASGKTEKKETSRKQETASTGKTGTGTGSVDSSRTEGGSPAGGSSGGNQTPAGNTPHTCTFDGGSVTAAATCSSEGVKTYTCTGCGKTKTESIPKTAHNYVTETKAATCTEAGYTKTCCSGCGAVESESSSGSPTGHNYTKSYWPSAPSCTNSGYYNLVCANCGENGGDGTDPALPHTPVSREENHGNCTTPTIIVTECSVCGSELGRESYFEDDHDWITGTYEEWDPVNEEIVIKESTYCSRCGILQ